MPTLSFITVKNGWPSINIGALRHQITIQQLLPSSPPVYNEQGETLSWQPFTTAQAAIEPISGKDVIRGGQTTTQLFLTIAIWYQPGIAANMRVISDNGSVYIIQSIENVLEMNQVLTLNCLGINQNL